MRSSFFADWRSVARAAAAMLLLFHLPFSLLFYLPSWSLRLTAWQIVKEVALLIVVAGLAAAALGLVAAALGRLLALLSERLSRLWIALLIWLPVLVVLLALRPLLLRWLQPVAGWLARLPGPNPSPELLFKAGLIAALGLGAILMFRRGPIEATDGFSRSLAGAERLLLAAVAASLVLVLATGHVALRPFGWKDGEPVATRAQGKPDVILISIDTLTAVDMSLYGYRLPTTPGLEAWARDAYVFERFYSNANWTRPSVASLLTGRYPTSHGAMQVNSRIADEDIGKSLPALLKAQGYVTAAITTNPVAHPMDLGLDRDFDYVSEPRTQHPARDLQNAIMLHRTLLYPHLYEWWFQPFRQLVGRAGEAMALSNIFPAEMVTGRSIEVLRQSGRPLFLWSHFLSPHEPYLPPAPFRGRFLDPKAKTVFDDGNPLYIYDPATQQAEADKIRLLYDEYIAYTDDAVTRFLGELKAAGALDNAIVLITSDHGESFERGWRTHGGPLLYDPLIRVPLLIKLPGQTQGARVESNGELVDLLPTIADLLGLPSPEWAEGESLKPALTPGYRTQKPKFAFDTARDSRFTPPRRGNLAVIVGSEKFIHRQASGCEEWYDLAADPQERRNLIAGMPPEKREHMRALLAQRTGAELKPREQREKPVPAERCARPFDY